MAALSPPGYSLLSDYFPPQRIARALAIFTMGLSVGGGAAYLIGGLVIEAVSTAEDIVLPLIGVLRPWQAVFLIVGAPGLLVALLMYGIREPERRGQLRDASGRAQGISLAFVWRFLLDRRRLYFGFPIGTALLGVFSYGMMAWYPTFLIRTYGMSMGEAGLWFGLTYLVFGPLGTYWGARFAERLESRGRHDAHMRFTMFAALAMTVPAMIGPLMQARRSRCYCSRRRLSSSAVTGTTGAMQLVTQTDARSDCPAVFFGNIVSELGPP